MHCSLRAAANWEIEYKSDGTIEIEKFISDGQIFDDAELDVLFRDFSDDNNNYSLSQWSKVRNMYTRDEFFELLKELNNEKHYYQLRKSNIDERILVEVVEPGYRWKIRYFSDGLIEIEKI